jgi:fatty acid-binding protein DegV
MLADKVIETAVEGKDAVVGIAHGDCTDDAKFVEKLIKDKLGTKNITIDYLTPIIGAHSGPGTMALFFMGKGR